MLPTATQIVMIDSVSYKMDVSVPTILCGDFNCVLDRSVDRRDRHRTTTHVRVSRLSLLFLMRPRSPMSGGISILRRLPSFLVDLIGCPYAWLSRVSSSDIHPCPFSDHCAIYIVFSIPEAAQPGLGVWKLNTSILEDDKYVDLISTFWGHWRQAQGSYPSVIKWWDAGKSRIKGITIAYSFQKAQRASAARDLLTRLASHLKSHVDVGFVDCMVPYRSTLAQLEQLDITAARGAQVRSRSRWSEEGESLSAIFSPARGKVWGGPSHLCAEAEE